MFDAKLTLAKFRKISFRSGTLLLSFSAAFAGPTFIQSMVETEIDFRSVAIPLKIKLDRFSLASSALEDVRLRNTPAVPHYNKQKHVDSELRAGERIFKMDSTKSHRVEPYSDWFHVPHITIAEYEAEAQRYQPKNILANTSALPSSYVEKAQAFVDKLAKRWTQPPVVTKSDRSVSAGNTAVFIAGGASSRPSEASKINASDFNYKQSRIAALSKKPALDLDVPVSEVGDVLRQGLSALELNPAKSNKDIQYIFGRIELSQGLAYLPGSQNLSVVRMDEGQATGDVAQIHYSEGTFRMRVSGDIGGHLVATLRDDVGEIVGMGRREITGVKNQEILIKPLAAGLEGQVISAYSFGSNLRPISDARIEVLGTSIETRSIQDGSFMSEQVAAGSQLSLRIAKNGYWPTQVIVRGGENPQIPLFPSSMVTALGDWTVGRENLKGSVIWGQVKINGRPVARAQVELAQNDSSVNTDNLKPIYFGASESVFWPNPELKMTSENGYFAFVNVDEGPQTLRIIIPGRKQADVQVVSTESKTVTYTVINVDPLDRKEITVNNALNLQQKVPAIVRWMGAESGDEFDPQHGSQIVLEPANTWGLQQVEIDAGKQWALSRQSLARVDGKLMVSPVPNEFIQKAAQRLGVAIIPGAGTVVGLVQGRLSGVDLEVAGWAGELLYFTNKGEFTDRPDLAQDGGFIALNVPEGLHSVQIFGKNQKRSDPKRAIKLVMTETDYANVVYHQFPN